MPSIDWGKLVETTGVSFVVLLAIGWAISRVAVYFAKQIYEPIRDKLLERIVRFFDNLDSVLMKLGASSESQAKMLMEMKEVLNRLDQLIRSEMVGWKTTCQDFHQEVREVLHVSDRAKEIPK